MDSIDRLSNGNYSIVYSGRNYTVRMSDNNAPEAPEAGEEIVGVEAMATTDATAANIKANLVDGAYTVPASVDKTQIANDIMGKIEDHIIFKFTLADGTQAGFGTLIVKDAAGKTVYEETSTYTPPESNAPNRPLNNFFYVKVLDSDNSGVLNAGRGSLKTVPLNAGTYTWEISGTNIRTISDTFTIN